MDKEEELATTTQGAVGMVRGDEEVGAEPKATMAVDQVMVGRAGKEEEEEECYSEICIKYLTIL